MLMLWLLRRFFFETPIPKEHLSSQDYIWVCLKNTLNQLSLADFFLLNEVLWMISKDYKYRYIKTDAGQNVLNRKVLYVYAQFDPKKI